MIIADILKLKGSKVITISPDESLKTAIDLLEEYNIGALVVLSDSAGIAGIISERDLIRYAASSDPDFSIPVRRVMTREVVVGILQDDLTSVTYTMTEKHFRHLPIVEEAQFPLVCALGKRFYEMRVLSLCVLHLLERTLGEDQVFVVIAKEYRSIPDIPYTDRTNPP